MKKIKTIVCFFAHPDDEVFVCGGTLARFADVGAKIYLVCTTDGRHGGKGWDHNLSTTQMKRIRNREIMNSVKTLGISKLICWHYHDNKLINASEKNITKRIRKVLNKYNPDLVITFGKGGVTGHADHRAISSFSTSAFKSWLNNANSILWHARYEKQVEKKFKLHDNLSPRENCYVNIKKYGEIKLQAIHIHASQVYTRARVGEHGENASKKFFAQETFIQVYPKLTKPLYI